GLCFPVLHSLDPPRPDQVTHNYPVALDLRDRLCLVVGGGSVAEAKVDGLLAAGARVTVVSPELTETLASWAADGRISHRPHGYGPDELEGQQLVFAATGRPGVRAAGGGGARAAGGGCG